MPLAISFATSGAPLTSVSPLTTLLVSGLYWGMRMQTGEDVWTLDARLLGTCSRLLVDPLHGGHAVNQLRHSPLQKRSIWLRATPLDRPSGFVSSKTLDSATRLHFLSSTTTTRLFSSVEIPSTMIDPSTSTCVTTSSVRRYSIIPSSSLTLPPKTTLLTCSPSLSPLSNSPHFETVSESDHVQSSHHRPSSEGGCRISKHKHSRIATLPP